MTCPQLICFDLGGVLVQLADGWHGAFRDAGVDPQLFNEIDDLQDVLQATNDWETGHINTTDYEAHLIKAVPGIRRQDIHAVLNHWVRQPYDQVDQMFDQLQQQGLQIAVLSNTNPWHWEMVLTQPIYQFMHQADHIVASFNVGAMKPDPAIYRHLETLANVPGQQIVFFDDRPENIQAAQARHWRGCLIDPAQPTMPQVDSFLNTVL